MGRNAGKVPLPILHGFLNIKLISACQKKLPSLGDVVLAILLASDKTNLSLLSGDAAVHPVYVSLGNFLRHQRVKESLELSVCIAMLPELVAPTDTVKKSEEFRA